MALTRKFLTALGIEADKQDEIISAHADTVDGLKEQLATASKRVEQFEAVEKELNTLKAEKHENYKEKYEQEHNAFEQFKSDLVAKETQAAKEKAARAFFESRNITGANLEIALRGSQNEIKALELDGDNIKDASALDALVSGTYSGLVLTRKTKGVDTPTPPSNTGGTTKTKEEIRQIKDTTARQKAIAENLSLYGR